MQEPQAFWRRGAHRNGREPSSLCSWCRQRVHGQPTLSKECCSRQASLCAWSVCRSARVRRGRVDTEVSTMRACTVCRACVNCCRDRQQAQERAKFVHSHRTPRPARTHSTSRWAPGEASQPQPQWAPVVLFLLCVHAADTFVCAPGALRLRGSVARQPRARYARRADIRSASAKTGDITCADRRLKDVDVRSLTAGQHDVKQRCGGRTAVAAERARQQDIPIRHWPAVVRRAACQSCGAHRGHSFC